MAIDVIFVNKVNEVVKVCPDVQPGCWSLSSREAHGLIELGGGTVANHDIQLGHQLQIS